MHLSAIAGGKEGKLHMFSTIRWCQYTSAAALLGLACSSSSSTPSKTADSASGSAAASQGMGAHATHAGASQTEPSQGATLGTSGASTSGASTTSGANTISGSGASSASHASVHGSGAAARSDDTAGSGDIAAHERTPVAGRDEAPQLDDPRIIAVTNAANEAEVEQGRLARERAKDPRVRDFAAMMVDHHSQALSDQQKLKIDPEPGADVLNMQRESKQRLGALREKKGSDFDRAYIELQIEEHRRLLDKINRELMPAAKDKSVVSYLEEIRPRVESHLAQAQRLQQELGSTSQSDTRKRDDSRTTISNERGSAARISDPK